VILIFAHNGVNAVCIVLKRHDVTLLEPPSGRIGRQPEIPVAEKCQKSHAQIALAPWVDLVTALPKTASKRLILAGGEGGIRTQGPY
jgi:hypothetical protein